MFWYMVNIYVRVNFDWLTLWWYADDLLETIWRRSFRYFHLNYLNLLGTQITEWPPAKLCIKNDKFTQKAVWPLFMITCVPFTYNAKSGLSKHQRTHAPYSYRHHIGVNKHRDLVSHRTCSVRVSLMLTPVHHFNAQPKTTSISQNIGTEKPCGNNRTQCMW